MKKRVKSSGTRFAKCFIRASSHIFKVYQAGFIISHITDYAKYFFRGKKIEREIAGYYRQQLDQIAHALLKESNSETIHWRNVCTYRDRLNSLVKSARALKETSGYDIDELIHVIAVEPLDNYKLRVKLSDGRKGIFDMLPYLDGEVFRELKNPEYFRQVYIDYDTVVWPHGQDIAPETIEFELQPEPTDGKLPRRKVDTND